MREYDDIELTNKINSFLTRKGMERFGTANQHKVRSRLKSGNHTQVLHYGQPKSMQVVNDRDRSPHYFRVASPHFNLSR